MYKTNGLLDSCHQKDLDVGDTWHSAPRPCRGHRRRNSSIYFRNPNLRPSVGQWALKRGYWENESADHPVAQVSSSRLSSSWSLIPDTLSCSPAWEISSCSNRLLFSCIIEMPGCVSVFPAWPRDPWSSGLSPELRILHSGNGIAGTQQMSVD